MSNLFTLKLKLLMKSALSLIFCMCIHNSKICLMQTNNVILIFNIQLRIFIIRMLTICSLLLDE